MGWSEALKEAGEGYSSRAGKSYLSHGHGAAAGFARGLGGLNKEGGARISESMSNHIATGAMGAVGIGGAAAVASNAQNSPVGAGIGGVAMAGALGAAMFMKPGAGAKAAGEALGDIGKAAGEVHGPPLPPAAAAAAPAAAAAAPAGTSQASSLHNVISGQQQSRGQGLPASLHKQAQDAQTAMPGSHVNPNSNTTFGVKSVGEAVGPSTGAGTYNVSSPSKTYYPDSGGYGGGISHMKGRKR